MRALIAVVMAAGCNSSSTCEDLAQWSIEISRVGGAPHEGADAAAGRAPDGTIYLAMQDSAPEIMFGAKKLTDAYVARVDDDGSVLALIRAPEGDSSVSAARLVVSDRGSDVVVKWAEPDSLVASYDEALTLRWTRSLPGTTYSSVFEVGPQGEVVAITQASSPTVYYVAADGSLAWQKQLPSGTIGSNARVTENGDVFVFTVGRRLRLAAADGAQLEQLTTPGLPFLGRRDGSYISVDYTGNGEAPSAVTSYDAAAQQQWSTPIDVQSLEQDPIFASTGDVVALVSSRDGRFQLLSFDAKSGELRHGAASCAEIDVFSADADHYYGVGYAGSRSVGLARFANR